MGLDTVELVMEVEEKFGIELPDEELDIRTVGDLEQLVSRLYCEKCSTTDCNSQKAFYRLRKALVEELGFERNQIKPDTPTEEVFPEPSRIDAWTRISKKTQVKFPDLRYPSIYYNAIGTLTIAFWIIILLMISFFFFIVSIPAILWKTLMISIVLLFGLILMVLVLKNFSSFKNYWIRQIIPASCDTLGKLSQSIVCYNVDLFKPYGKNEILQILTSLISDQSGLEIEKIKPETPFKEIFPYDYK